MSRVLRCCFAARATLSVAQSPVALAATSTITYYHNDITGSPVAATNAAKQVVWHESYRPYGERTQLEAASVSNEIWNSPNGSDTSDRCQHGRRGSILEHDSLS